MFVLGQNSHRLRFASCPSSFLCSLLAACGRAVLDGDLLIGVELVIGSSFD